MGKVMKVLIEGDASAPFSRQLLELQVLLRNWGPMAEQLDSMLSSKSQQKHKEKIYGSWQNDFIPIRSCRLYYIVTVGRLCFTGIVV